MQELPSFLQPETKPLPLPGSPTTAFPAISLADTVKPRFAAEPVLSEYEQRLKYEETELRAEKKKNG
jgi:hypothetical protein